METAQTGEAGELNDTELTPFFYSINEIPAHSIAQMVEGLGTDEDAKQTMYDIFGRDLMTKVILQSPTLSVFHELAQPGERVKPHRHGTNQITCATVSLGESGGNNGRQATLNLGNGTNEFFVNNAVNLGTGKGHNVNTPYALLENMRRGVAEMAAR